jgi:hypothetical protein
MNSTAPTTDHRSLQLSGTLLWLYRLTWLGLAIGAVLASALLPFQSMAYPAVIGLRLVKSAVLISAAIVLAYRRRRDPVAALLALAFLTWTITSSLDFGTHATFAQLLDRCRFLLFVLALLLFPEGNWRPHWTRLVAAMSGAVFLLGIGEVLNLLQTRLYLPLAIACVVGGIASLVARFRASTNFASKQQLKWVALGLVVGVGLILCARAGSALDNSRAFPVPIIWEGLFQLGIITVALGFLISLLRYRLFDAETVITRSAAYATLTIALVATFGGTEAFIQNVGQDYLGMDIGGISGGMAAAVAAVLLSPLHGHITEWAEDRFQPDLAQLKREMPELLARLATSSTRRLCDAALSHMSAAIHVQQSALVLNGRVLAARGMPLAAVRRWTTRALEEDFICDPFPVRLPLGTGGPDVAAWLFIGPRPDGTLCGKEDLDAVRSILPAIRHALSVATTRDALNAAVDRREKRIRAEIDGLRLRLNAIEETPVGWR